MAQTVQGDGGDDDHADDDLLDIRRPAHLLRAVSQESHDQCAEQRPQHRAFAAVALDCNAPARPKNKPASA